MLAIGIRVMNKNQPTEIEALGQYYTSLEWTLVYAAREMLTASRAGYGPINREWVEEAAECLKEILDATKT